MATKKVDVEIDVNSNVKESVQGLRDLRKELRNAAAGSDEFKKISADIRDVEDAIELWEHRDEYNCKASSRFSITP
jgi:hypothetical protein